MLATLLQIALIAGGVYVIVRLLGGRRVLSFSSSPGSEFKCSTCRHCKRVDADGSICRYGNKETFKNPVHIQNCNDYERK